MDDVKNMVRQLIAHESEEDWFEFKDSWYDANGIGNIFRPSQMRQQYMGKKGLI